MKALHVIPALAARYGGPSKAAVGMARALRGAGVEVLLAATNADGRKALPVDLEVPTSFRGLPAIFFERHWTEAFKVSPGLAAWARAHVADFDVVHIHGVFSHPCLTAAAACRDAGVPYVVRPLGQLSSWSLSTKPLRKKVAWSLGVRDMLEGASAIHYTSASERGDVEASLGLTRGVVIPLGVTVNDVPVDRPVRPYVVSISRIHPKKRIELLIDAFLQATACEELREWRLVIAGDGDPAYVRRLIEMVFKSRVENRVLFTGWLDGAEKDHVLRDASLFALTSSHENFGISVAEAMAAAVPVLVSDGVDLASDVRQADAGWVVGLDPQDIRKKLRDAMLHPTLRRTRAANGRRLVEERYTWPRIAEQLVTLYEGLVASSIPTSMPRAA